MFPWYHGYQIFKELPEDDRLAIQQIYGKLLFVCSFFFSLFATKFLRGIIEHV